ncbi:MAG: IS1634 family transposase [Oscillospiraceae bacterium]|nr:IS1634 family transposase [Oscillospiraceae bacterium]
MAYRLDVKDKKRGAYLIIEKKYWDRERKTSVTEHYKTLGYADDLRQEYPDPIAHYREEVAQMNSDQKALNKITLDIDMNEELPKGTHARYNLGHAVILYIYHELELDRFLNNKARHAAFEYNSDSIMKLLVISRILRPSSKRDSFEHRGAYFERFDFELHDVYRALGHFSKIGEQCQRFISDQIFAKYGRNTTLMYFDVTNVYFEIDKGDDLRKRGKEKNNRPDPIVQLALAMDADGLPLYYKQFPGNTNDSKTFIPVFKEVCVRYAPGRVIAVADMGCTSSDNIYFLKGGGRERRVNGYVFSFSIRKGADLFKQYVLREAGYTDRDGKPLEEGYGYKVKSRIEVREIKITMSGGSKKAVQIVEKQVVFWSAKYALKAQAEREESIKKAHEIIADPKKYNKDTVHGGASYVKNITYCKKTGEVIEEPGKKLIFDSEKAEEDAKYDGYYCIVTSELEMDDQRVIDIYRGLSDIEDNFKVSKNNLEIRPCYVAREDHINSHILTCFISLVIMRLIQKKTNYSFTPAQIIDTLNNISCSLEHDNIYLFDCRTAVTDALGEAFGIDFSKKRLFLNHIKNIIANAKKR